MAHGFFSSTSEMATEYMNLLSKVAVTVTDFMDSWRHMMGISGNKKKDKLDTAGSDRNAIDPEPVIGYYKHTQHRLMRLNYVGLDITNSIYR